MTNISKILVMIKHITGIKSNIHQARYMIHAKIQALKIQQKKTSTSIWHMTQSRAHDMSKRNFKQWNSYVKLSVNHTFSNTKACCHFINQQEKIKAKVSDTWTLIEIEICAHQVATIHNTESLPQDDKTYGTRLAHENTIFIQPKL